MPIQIPDRLLERLQGDALLMAHVREAVELFSPWYEISGLPFFPDYTDHGPGHVSTVLRTAEGIISDEAWNSFSSSDSALLILATLLHDCALHFREQTFQLLISDDTRPQLLEMGDRPWSESWREYLMEARRFDAKQLHRIFGDTDPVTLPPEDSNQWSRRDRLLIGEFLRRHHPRIAHEIALYGVPGKPGKQLQLPGDLRDFADLAGLIARSHGISIRDTLPYLQAHFGGSREYRGCHAVFLMAVLRVADYLQLQASRAPSQLLQVAGIRSPVSKGEWLAHASVRDISHVGDDPEAITVHAVPSDVRAFLRIRDWLNGIQNELDTSWAVLGEVYGRIPSLNKLGLVLRRVRSNLDDLKAFANSVPYIPTAAAFSTADASLLKLLVAPLYGDEPGVGIRELLQNAVDAVRERAIVTRNRVEGIAASGGESLGDAAHADVSIKLGKDADGEWWLEIDDRGIGMTAMTVRDYFLRAGASYRYSDAWRRIFEDPTGTSRVLRSGRFGVGAVAAFLLGDQIEVVTRHLDSSPQEGVAFSAGLEDDVVELRRVECSPGTTIRVKLRPHAVETLQLGVLATSQEKRLSEAAASWDWYCLSIPRVIRHVEGRTIQQGLSLPAAGQSLPSDWQRISTPDYQDVQWSFTPGLPHLVVNGIKISDKASHAVREPPFGMPHMLFVRSLQGEYALRQPSISVFDPNGRLPLNLQRTALAAAQYPFREELESSVAMQFIAEVAVHGPTKCPIAKDEWAAFASWGARGYCLVDVYGSQRVLWGPFFATSSGFGLADAEIVAGADIQRHSLVPFSGYDVLPWSSTAAKLSPGTAVLPVHLDIGYQALYRLIRRCLYPAFDGTDRLGAPYALRRVLQARILLPANLARDARAVLRRAVLRRVDEEDVAPGWVIWTIGTGAESEFEAEAIVADIESTERTSSKRDPVIFGELLLDAPRAHATEALCAKYFLRAFGGPTVPYSRETRVEALLNLGDEWLPYIESAKNRTLPPSRRFSHAVAAQEPPDESDSEAADGASDV